MESILTSIKKMLGIEEEYTHFDPDIIMHINSTFMTLNQLGVGPQPGFSISDKSTIWDEYVDPSMDFEGVKTFIFLKVRLIFDPPSTSFVIDAMERQIKELEWRLNIRAEGGI